MTVDRGTIEDLRARYDRCFGCGRANPIGLHLDEFTLDDGWFTAAFVPRPEFAGFADTLHGGIVATALDETSAWAAMLTHHVLVFTATLDIRYRSVAPASASYVMHGIVEERRGRRMRIAARMTADGTTVAESSGLFVIAEEHTSALGDVTNR